MSDINVRSDSVDVEQIMKQIRARVREKRGSDYTEAEVQQLASVKMERFLDPRGVRSDLAEQYRRNRVVHPIPPNYTFEDTTLFETHRGLLRTIRRLLRPILKLFINPDPIASVLNTQAGINTQTEVRLRRIEEREPLSYELQHNLIVEVTRLGIEVQNLKMRLESVSSRLDFDERRARSLESVVQYRPSAQQRPSSDHDRSQAPAQPAERVQGAQQSEDRGPGPGQGNGPGSGQGQGQGQGQGEGRRRRRRRRRRPGQTMADAQGGGQAIGSAETASTGGSDADDTGGDFDGPDTPDTADQ